METNMQGAESTYKPTYQCHTVLIYLSIFT